MKIFLLKLSLFAIIIIVVFAGLILSSDYLIDHKRSQLLKLNDDIHFVFAGNSAVECAVNDRLIDHSINIAESGEAYLYSYVKIKALVDVNEQIEAIFIGYSFADLLFEKEESWLFSDEYIIEKVKSYNYLLEPQERKLLLANNPKAYLHGLLRSVLSNVSSALGSNAVPKSAGELVNFGGYKLLVRDRLMVDPGLASDNDPIIKSPQQEKYLRMISDLCQRHQVRMVLFTTPKHVSYIESLDKENYSLWLDVRNSLPSDSLLDLSGFVLPDSCFGDLSHLNYRGARLFSGYLDILLNQGN